MIARYLTVALLAFGCVSAAAGTAVAQKDCTDETKTWQSATNRAAIRTVVKNETSSEVFAVSIYRNAGEKLKSKSIASGEDAAYRMGVSRLKSDPDVAVKIVIERGEANLTCNYNVKYGTKTGIAKYSASWYLPDGNTSICPDVSAICADCKLNCSKFWDGSGSSGVWRTVLTIAN